MARVEDLKLALGVSLGLSLASSPLLAQAAKAKEPAASLADLLNCEVEIATKRLQRVEEAPSIVSVITRTEIELYGWRELGEILQALPGFDFGNDGTSLIGLSARGIWAHEGKVLLMVNGVTLTPLHNGNINYYGSYPSEMIERVEVIRGPGSAVYGQFAGAAVINIITRGGRDAEGGRIVLRGTTLGAGDHGGGAYLSATGQFLNEVSLSLSAGFQTTPFSRQPYVDTFFTGQSFDQSKGNSRRENSYFALDLGVLGAKIHAVRHAFQSAQVDSGGSGNNVPEVPGIPAGALGTPSRYIQGLRVDRAFALGQNFSLDAMVEELQNTGGSIYPQDPNAHGVNHSGTERSRFTGELGLRWTPETTFAAITAQLGGGFIQDWERSLRFAVDPDTGRLVTTGALRDPRDPMHLVAQQTVNTRYVYTQLVCQVRNFGATLGARYQDSEIGHAFAPRLGLTYATGPFNAKLLYGEAYRAPTLFQTYSTFFSFRGFLQPERIRSTELELGWRFTPHVQGKVNLYRMSVTNSISFGLDAADPQQAGIYYLNAGSTHAKGIEASLEVSEVNWGGFANLSLAKPDGLVDPFFLSGDGKDFLGISPLKINLGAFYYWGPLRIAPSLSYVSSRQGQTARSANSGLVPGQFLPVIIESESFPARILLNLTLGWHGLLGKDTDARLSVRNLGGADYPVLQPYYGFHAPLPANDRRITADLVWRF